MYGDEIKEEDVVNKIFCTVIEAYDSAAGVIESTKGLSTLTVLEVVGMMKAQEERVNRRSKTSLEGAFQTSHKNKNVKKQEVRNTSKSNFTKGRNVAEKKDKFPPCGI